METRTNQVCPTRMEEVFQHGKVLLALTTLLGLPAAHAQSPVAEVEAIHLHGSFWVNLHMTLYADTLAGMPAEPGLPQLVARPGAPLASDLTGADRAAWDAAIAYYAPRLARRDLRTGEGMTAIQQALVDSRDALAESAALAAEHRRHLLAAEPVYRRRWWPEHDRAIRAWIADVVEKLEELGPQPRERVVALLETGWFSAPVRAEITYYGRAYTTLEPTLTTIAIADPAYAGWAGTEMLFHEVGHALIEPMRQRIRRVAIALAKDVDPGLWHVCQFYIVGQVWRSTLAARDIEYVPYVYANGLFERTWKPLRAPVETHLGPYVEGRIAADVAFRNLVEAVAK